jgi:hypothetical protein
MQAYTGNNCFSLYESANYADLVTNLTAFSNQKYPKFTFASFAK